MNALSFQAEFFKRMLQKKQLEYVRNNPELFCFISTALFLGVAYFFFSWKFDFVQALLLYYIISSNLNASLLRVELYERESENGG